MAIYRMSSQALFLIGMIAMTMAITFSACEPNRDTDAEGQETITVHGLVQDVNVRSLLEIISLTVRDHKGQDWVIQAGTTQISSFPPSHIREHMVLGQPVTVFFHQENGVFLLDDIID